MRHRRLDKDAWPPPDLDLTMLICRPFLEREHGTPGLVKPLGRRSRWVRLSDGSLALFDSERSRVPECVEQSADCETETEGRPNRDYPQAKRCPDEQRYQHGEQRRNDEDPCH